MSNDLLTINGVPIVYKSYLPTDDDDVAMYVRNIRSDDDLADSVLILGQRNDE